MTEPSVAGVDPLLVGYVAAFAVAALACFASVARTASIPDPDTRRGLVALLLTSGAWAGSYVGFLLAPTPAGREAFYLLGLTVGLAAVGAWLYFCSAYTGRSLHRSPALRRLALGVFLAIMALKATNPLHGAYYETTAVTAPFPHLAVEPGVFHWLAMALAYALSFVGYFMLLERFYHVDYDTRPLVVLVSLTALPAVFDVVGSTTASLVNVPYEPLGVAAFAVGVLFVYREAFRSVQITGDHDVPAVYLDEDRHVREYNRAASELFPALDGATGRPLADALPSVAATLETDGTVLEREGGGLTRYYRVTASPFTAGESRIGELLTVTDVTEAEQYRRELERTTERLDSFASVVAHDLRNPLSVAQGYASLEREERDSEALAAIDDSLGRMETIVDDLLTLARQGRDIGETERVSLSSLVERCWREVETTEATLVVEADVEVEADASRLQQLLENLFRNAVEHGATSRRPEADDAVEHGSATPQHAGDAVEHADPEVTVTVGPLPDRQGFYVADDGPGIPETVRDTMFDPGVTTAEGGTGFGLAIVEQIAAAHGWAVTATDADGGGARFEFETG